MDYLVIESIPLVDVSSPSRQAAIKALLDRFPVNPDPTPEEEQVYQQARAEWLKLYKAHQAAVQEHAEVKKIKSKAARDIALAELAPIPEEPKAPMRPHSNEIIDNEESDENSNLHAVIGVYEELFDYSRFGHKDYGDEEATVTMPGIATYICLEGGSCHDPQSWLGNLFQDISRCQSCGGDAISDAVDEFMQLITAWRDEDYPWLANNGSTLAESNDDDDEEVSQ